MRMVWCVGLSEAGGLYFSIASGKYHGLLICQRNWSAGLNDKFLGGDILI